MRSERREAWVAGLEHLVQRHAHLLVGPAANEMESRALGKSDVEMTVCRPEVDWDRLEREAEAALGVQPVRWSLRGWDDGGRGKSPQRPLDEAGEWSEGPEHCRSRAQLASHSLTSTS